jgi:hypothetical protein
VRVSALALISVLVCAGMIADRVPEPPRPSRASATRQALRAAREAGHDAVTACIAYVMSDERPVRDIYRDCSELLSSGAVPEDVRPVPAPPRDDDRPGITL